MYSRLGNGFKSNHTLLKEVIRNPRSYSNSSRLSLADSIHQQKTQSYRQSMPQMLDRLITNLERILDDYLDLPVILKGQLNSLIKLGRKMSITGAKNIIWNNDKQNLSNNCPTRQSSREKLVMLDRLKTQSQIQVLMEKLVRSKEKRVKLADENFILKGKNDQLLKQQQRLKKMVQNQNQLIQSCIKQIDKLKLSGSNGECDQDLLSMITLQAQQMQKIMRKNKLKRRV